MISTLLEISKAKVKKYKNKEIVSVSFFNALANIVKIIGNFVISKFLAVTTGPAGITIIGQLTNFNAIVVPCATGAINTGVTKYLSEYSNNLQKLKNVTSTAIKITFFSSLAISAFIFIFSNFLSQFLFKTNEYSSILKLFAFTIILIAFNNLMIGILRGFNEFRTINKINIISSFFSVIYTVALIYYFSISGALISFVTAQSIIIIVTIFYFIRTKKFDKTFIREKFDINLAKQLGGYTIMIVTTAFTVPVSQLLIRNHMIQEFGMYETGLWEGLNQLSKLFVTFITTSVGFYFMPKLSSLFKARDIRSEILSAAKLVFPITLSAIIGIYFGRVLIIEILFSEEFKSMENLFLFQLIGDFFRVVAWLFSTLLIAKALHNQFIILEIVSAALLAILSFVLINSFGIKGAVIAYAITYTLYAITLYFSYRNYLKKLA